MYALPNIARFLVYKIQKEEVSNQQAREIFKRAESLSSAWLISGGSIDEIMGSDVLAQEFHEAAQSDPEYFATALRVMAVAKFIKNISSVLMVIVVSACPCCGGALKETNQKTDGFQVFQCSLCDEVFGKMSM